VVIEAFRQHTPVVARKIGALTEMVHESGGGLLYETDAQLRACMDQLLAGTTLRARLGASGYAAYERDHTPDVHLQRYFDLIESLAAQRPALKNNC
jgi:glycosyltransferase involved in cell wall biosynthesis